MFWRSRLAFCPFSTIPIVENGGQNNADSVHILSTRLDTMRKTLNKTRLAFCPSGHYLDTIAKLFCPHSAQTGVRGQNVGHHPLDLATSLLRPVVSPRRRGVGCQRAQRGI